ncbi:hypothetical protein ABTL89_23685, partial [Acinetobacter baumannii]
ELQKLAEQYGIFQPYDQLTWVAQGQSCDIKDYIKAADWILISPDSTSMVAEVVMSGSKLLVLYDGAAVQDVNIKRQLNFLAEQHWLGLLDVYTEYHFSKIIQTLQVQNHVEDINKKLKELLF